MITDYEKALWARRLLLEAQELLKEAEVELQTALSAGGKDLRPEIREFLLRLEQGLDIL